jgi:hypothetical protein
MSGGVLDLSVWQKLTYYIQFDNGDSIVKFYNFQRKIGDTTTLPNEYFKDDKSKRLFYGADFDPTAAEGS